MIFLILWIVFIQYIMGLQIKYHSSQTCSFINTPCFDESVPDKITVGENEPFLLQCYVYQANFSKILITWWKEGSLRELSLGKKIYESRYHLPRQFYEDWSLQVKNSRMSDSGTYICQINLINLSEKFFNVQIKKDHQTKYSNTNYVKDEGFKSYSHKTVTLSAPGTVEQGQPLTISCSVYFPESFSDASIQWFHNNTRQNSDYPNSLSQSLSQDNSDASFIEISLRWLKNNTAYSVLSISRVNKKHSGKWSCVKVTGIESKPKETANTKIIVTDAARIFKSDMSLYGETGAVLSDQSKKSKSSVLSTSLSLVLFVVFSRDFYLLSPISKLLSKMFILCIFVPLFYYNHLSH